MHEAMLFDKLDDNKVRCNLCGHRCVIPEGKIGVCHVRENIGGTLYTMVYGNLISSHVDPIEKKPLYHYLPGSRSFSIATPGCNFQCIWCQNWEIAQMPRNYDIHTDKLTPPEQVVQSALASGSATIAYTYTEPTIFFEYAYDTSRLARQAGIGNLYVTNGYMTTEMLDTYNPYLDAANVDLKAFNKKTYHRYVGAGLQPVLDSMIKMKKLGVWLEVTTLVIPGINDQPDELRQAAEFVACELGVDTPWHISRFFPHYKMRDIPATPLQTMELAQAIGQELGLKYVYLGNVAGESNTYCPDCGQLLVRRQGYQAAVIGIDDNQCTNCGAYVAGVWQSAQPSV